MGVQERKKIIAIFVVIVFIGVGVAWAVEQSGPQFQEKAGTPVVKKHKFPWLIVLLGTAAVGAGIYFLTGKKKEEQPQDVTLTFEQLGVSGVVRDYLILRKAHSGEELGDYVNAANTSSVTFTAPNSNTNYDLFLLNDGPAASLYATFWGSGP